MKCTKAIIPIAGYGTRRLPITKAIEKCMLPILNRPAIDYVVEDCVKAGVTDIYFVISEGATQIKEYYTQNPGLEAYLKVNGKEAALPLITPPAINFHFIEQYVSADSPYGTTIPVWLCREFIQPDEHVLVLTGDDFIYNADGSSEVARLIAAVAEIEGDSAMLGVEVPRAEVSRYGVIATHEQDGVQFFDHIQEKPSIEEAKSTLISVSKYIFSASFFAYLDASVKQGSKGEYQITDPLNAYVEAGNRMQVLSAHGTYLDSGTVENWLYANQFVFEHPVAD